MTLKSIFQKPVDRPIEGVIKADDEASLRLELEEYVLTNEVEKRIENFLQAYTNYEGANGVWISGFFGSGKSHLLKMLALLLENREIDGVRALDLFLPKCQDNEILRADLNKAVAIPSRSILFNIDQKADVISKEQIDALLSVFVKVFDEMCGYYGKQGHIAQFERDLDSRGHYKNFKVAYERIAGRPWSRGREQALFEGKHIASAYAGVVGGEESHALGILDKYRSQYKVSIEDFAEQVNSYIEAQPKGFRLNFFVDEVGQYIAENVKLMTNLQTIAESLATKCRGRAWVIVTAQEDMANVVGEMGKQQGNDFSKIQARFANRMKLTSADVAEVIQKRLLTKTEDGVNQLSEIYKAQANNFKTLFDFADGAASYRNYQDRDHFIHCYPFVPYQFSLFQAAIQDLSSHNAFEGKHSSVGERSMLGVFQQVAIHIGEHRIGQLATFDLMFEGIRTALKSQIQRAIIQAEQHLEHPFAIRILKALFLVKYVKTFKPTVRNLCVLMLESFDQPLPVLRKQVEEALSLLEQQTYIQRNGELYEYLTDEEKDVEQEIKNTEVEATDVTAELEKLVFDHVIKQRKIRYDGGAGAGQDYSYSRKLDDRLQGREHELSVNVITPFHEHADNPLMLRTSSTYKTDELFVVLPPDERLLRDLLMYKRTEKYIRQNISVTQQEAIKRILTDKGFQNRERFADLQQRVALLMGRATIMVGGADLDITSEDGQTRVIRGFHELIERAYPNLRMLRGIAYTENDVATCLKAAADGLFGNDATSLSEAEQELLAHIQSNNRGGVRTTLKNLLERFERKPYGWYYAAVLCVLAHLCARGKVEVRLDGNLLEDSELERALRNTHGHGNVVLEPQVEFTASQVRGLKTFYEDFFDAPPSSNEAKALGKEAANAFNELLLKLSPLAAQTAQYPFLQALKPVLDKLKELAGKPYTWLLKELPREADYMLDIKESVIDPLRKFMSGSQKDIYDAARNFASEQQANFGYVRSELPKDLKAALADPECYKGNRMQQLRSLQEQLAEQIDAQRNTELQRATTQLATLEARLAQTPEFARLGPDKQAILRGFFAELNAQLTQQPIIAVIRDMVSRFQDQQYRHLLESLPGMIHEDQAPAPVRPAPIVALRELNIDYAKPLLESEHDVDAYLKACREALLVELQQGKRIQL